MRKSKANIEGSGHSIGRPSKVSIVDDQPLDRSKSRTSTVLGARQSIAWRFGSKGFKVPKYQNSYRLEPHLPFRCEVSDTILAKVMTDTLEDVRYDTNTCATLCRDIATEVRDCLYKTNFDRVKYIVMITIAENAEQSMMIQHGRLWDPVRDTYSVFFFESPSLYAAGIVYALNYE